jgi:hypothetical protein
MAHHTTANRHTTGMRPPPPASSRPPPASPPRAPPPPPTSNRTPGGLPTAVGAAVALAVVLVVIAAGAGAWFYLRWRRRREAYRRRRDSGRGSYLSGDDEAASLYTEATADDELDAEGGGEAVALHVSDDRGYGGGGRRRARSSMAVWDEPAAGHGGEHHHHQQQQQHQQGRRSSIRAAAGYGGPQHSADGGGGFLDGGGERRRAVSQQLGKSMGDGGAIQNSRRRAASAIAGPVQAPPGRDGGGGGAAPEAFMRRRSTSAVTAMQLQSRFEEGQFEGQFEERQGAQARGGRRSSIQGVQMVDNPLSWDGGGEEGDVEEAAGGDDWQEQWSGQDEQWQEGQLQAFDTADQGNDDDEYQRRNASHEWADDWREHSPARVSSAAHHPTGANHQQPADPPPRRWSDESGQGAGRRRRSSAAGGSELFAAQQQQPARCRSKSVDWQSGPAGALEQQEGWWAEQDAGWEGEEGEEGWAAPPDESDLGGASVWGGGRPLTPQQRQRLERLQQQSVLRLEEHNPLRAWLRPSRDGGGADAERRRLLRSSPGLGRSSPLSGLVEGGAGDAAGRRAWSTGGSGAGGRGSPAPHAAAPGILAAYDAQQRGRGSSRFVVGAASGRAPSPPDRVVGGGGLPGDYGTDRSDRRTTTAGLTAVQRPSTAPAVADIC